MVYFWACEVSDAKAAVVKVPEGFVLNVCNATLASFAHDAASVSLGLETSQMDSKAWKGVVAHLGAAAHAHQVKVDLVFGIATQIKFFVAKGTGKVNLTGYFQPGPPADLFDDAPAMTTATTSDAGSKQSSKKNKKRARDEPVTWDQAEASDSDDEEIAKPATPAKAAAPAKPQQQAKSASKPVAPAAANGGSHAEGSSKKKKRKNKNKNADKKE